jgi:hypothetical protein
MITKECEKLSSKFEVKDQKLKTQFYCCRLSDYEPLENHFLALIRLEKLHQNAILASISTPKTTEKSSSTRSQKSTQKPEQGQEALDLVNARKKYSEHQESLRNKSIKQIDESMTRIQREKITNLYMQRDFMPNSQYLSTRRSFNNSGYDSTSSRVPLQSPKVFNQPSHHHISAPQIFPEVPSRLYPTSSGKSNVTCVSCFLFRYSMIL